VRQLAASASRPLRPSLAVSQIPVDFDLLNLQNTA
jgi:hypothetical protein